VANKKRVSHGVYVMRERKKEATREKKKKHKNSETANQSGTRKKGNITGPFTSGKNQFPLRWRNRIRHNGHEERRNFTKNHGW